MNGQQYTKFCLKWDLEWNIKPCDLNWVMESWNTQFIFMYITTIRDIVMLQLYLGSDFYNNF